MYKKVLDPEYSGVNIEKIKSAKPLINEEMIRRYAYYQKERTSIFVKKEIQKLPAPWSENPMFQNFKFTMTKRYLDRESRNLINGILHRDDISYKNKILNCIIFRMINKWKLFEVLPNKYVNFDNLTNNDYLNLKQIIKDSGISGWFTDAYFVSGPIRALRRKNYGIDINSPKTKSNPLDSTITIIDFVNQNKEHFLKVLSMDNPEDMLNHLSSTYTLGKFLSAQIMMDWTYIPEFPYSDNSCCDIGPGTEKGLKHFFTDFDGLTLKEAVYWIRENIQLEMDKRGLEWDLQSWFSFLEPHQRVWTLQDITNSFCEFDKTTRIWTEDLMNINRKRVRKYNVVSNTKEELEKNEW